MSDMNDTTKRQRIDIFTLDLGTHEFTIDEWLTLTPLHPTFFQNISLVGLRNSDSGVVVIREVQVGGHTEQAGSVTFVQCWVQDHTIKSLGLDGWLTRTQAEMFVGRIYSIVAVQL